MWAERSKVMPSLLVYTHRGDSRCSLNKKGGRQHRRKREPFLAPSSGRANVTKDLGMAPVRSRVI